MTESPAPAANPNITALPQPRWAQEGAAGNSEEEKGVSQPCQEEAPPACSLLSAPGQQLISAGKQGQGQHSLRHRHRTPTVPQEGTGGGVGGGSRGPGSSLQGGASCWRGWQRGEVQCFLGAWRRQGLAFWPPGLPSTASCIPVLESDPASQGAGLTPTPPCRGSVWYRVGGRGWVSPPCSPAALPRAASRKRALRGAERKPERNQGEKNKGRRAGDSALTPAAHCRTGVGAVASGCPLQLQTAVTGLSWTQKIGRAHV